MAKASALFPLSLVLVVVVSCLLALGHGEEVEALPPNPPHLPIVLPPAPPPTHHHHHPHPHPPAAAPAHPPHHHHHHHHPPPPPPPPTPAHPLPTPPPKPHTPPPKPATPPPKPHTPPPKPASPPPKPATPPPKPATPPPKPYTPPPKPPTPPPKPYTPPPKPVTPPPKPQTPPPKPATPPPKPHTPPPKPATPPPKPYTPPPKPSTPPPAKPPSHPPGRTYVAVQGVVYCKSCKYAGKDTLLGATPVANATVRLVCKNTKYKTVDYEKTDKNGYFFLKARKTVTNYGIHKCMASLLTSPLPNCRRPSLLHGGLYGATLRLEKHFFYNKLPYSLYTVGPFAFEPKCPRT